MGNSSNGSSFQNWLPARHWWPLVNRNSLQADAWAALTSAVMVLPQAIAFAAIAGLPFQYGFYTAIVTPIVAALFGSSRQMISGPTTAISVLLFGTLSSQFAPGSAEFIQAAISLTLMAGLFQVLFGLLRLGGLASFVSPSVMVGFTAGAAMIIFLSQLPNSLGLGSGELVQIWAGELELSATLNSGLFASVLVAFTSLLVAVLSLHYLPRWPNYLCALAAGTMLALLLETFGNDGEPLLAYVGSTSAIIPSFSAPSLSLDTVRGLAQSAFAVALVGLLEAAAISRSLAIKTGQDININQEFIGQGLSNTVGSFFSAYMGSGSFTRSAMNHAAGARTPLSAIFASLLLLLILLFVGDWIAYIPISAIAGIIMLVAYRLIEFDHIGNIFRTSRNSSVVMGVTFFATLVIGLEFGIYMGVFVSLMFFLRRSASPYLAMTAPDPETGGRYFRNAPAFELNECPQLGFGRLDGQLYFGSIEDIRRQLRRIELKRPQQKHLMLLMKGMGEIDMPGAELLIEEAERRKGRGGQLYITARRRQMKGDFRNYNVITAIEERNLYANKSEAIADIVPRLDQSVCATCEKRIFKECPPPNS